MDIRGNIIHRPAGVRIDHRAHTRALRPEKAMIHSHRLDQQLQGFPGVEHRIVVELAHGIGEAWTTLHPQALGLESSRLVGYGSTPVTDQDLQIRKIAEYI